MNQKDDKKEKRRKFKYMKELQLDDEPIKEKKRKVCIHKMNFPFCVVCHIHPKKKDKKDA